MSSFGVPQAALTAAEIAAALSLTDVDDLPAGVHSELEHASNPHTMAIDGRDVSVDGVALDANVTAAGLNTTHRGSDGKNHSDVVLANTHRGVAHASVAAVASNTTHRGQASGHADVAANSAAIAALVDFYTLVWTTPDDTDVTVDTTVAPSLIAPLGGTIIKAYAYARTAPTGADLIFDINKGGVTIWSTQADRVKILDGANSGSQTGSDVTTVSEGDVFDLDIDQIGSGAAGKDITVALRIQI